MSVVVGYVPDETGLLAVREAAREARWRDTEVIIVNVVDSAGYSRPTAADEQTMDAIAAELTSGGVRFSIDHVEGASVRPAEVLLSIARENGAQLIVVGLKRKSAIAKAVLGSNAQRVLLGATCPVLAVDARDE
ncbi:universal stress protein [uncultured Jatrophihabitans sp.]|uniref:universal stress protein n=1 Tax=uncultured Jatrophihabitans sp. TaxID=1610747 RepID=UPI0035C9F519